MQISAEKIWNTAQEHLRVRLGQATYKMWFAPLRASAVDGQHLTIEAPNEFCEVWLKDNYLSLMQDAVAIAAGARLQVKFKVNGAPHGAPMVVPVAPNSAPIAHPAPVRLAKGADTASDRASVATS